MEGGTKSVPNTQLETKDIWFLSPFLNMYVKRLAKNIVNGLRKKINAEFLNALAHFNNHDGKTAWNTWIH